MPGEDRSSSPGKPERRAKRVRRLLKSLKSRRVVDTEFPRERRRNCLANDTKDRVWRRVTSGYLRGKASEGRKPMDATGTKQGRGGLERNKASRA
jgi:hypothetical protein